MAADIKIYEKNTFEMNDKLLLEHNVYMNENLDAGIYFCSSKNGQKIGHS